MRLFTAEVISNILASYVRQCDFVYSVCCGQIVKIHVQAQASTFYIR